MVALLFTIVVIVLLCGGAIWVITKLNPNHPPIIDAMIWVLCVVVIGVLLANAFGLVDIPVPRLGR